MLVPWLAELGNDLVPVRDEDADAALDLAQICAQVVLQVLDSNPRDRLHGFMVATGSH